MSAVSGTVRVVLRLEGLCVLIAAGLIWTAHVRFDRALGYGLKYSAGYSFTHLGRIGRSPDVSSVTH
jgi:uncharacterized protein DUF4260